MLHNGQCIVNVVDQVEAKTRLHKRMVDICANVEVEDIMLLIVVIDAVVVS
jgi:hypothetical protein